jgi:hypothetical protein
VSGNGSTWRLNPDTTDVRRFQSLDGHYECIDERHLQIDGLRRHVTIGTPEAQSEREAGEKEPEDQPKAQQSVRDVHATMLSKGGCAIRPGCVVDTSGRRFARPSAHQG